MFNFMRNTHNISFVQVLSLFYFAIMPGLAGRKFRVVAPGKVILHGEHAVVYNKKAVAISVGLYTTLDVSISADNCVTIKFPGIAINVCIPLQDLTELKKKLGPNYNFEMLNAKHSIPLNEEDEKIIYEFIKANIDLIPPYPELAAGQLKATEAFLGLFLAIFDNISGFTFEIKTDLPIGAGLGSSASFGVALVGGMLLAAGRITLNQTTTTDDLAMINRWSFFSEKFVHGSPSGIDNHVATFGDAVMFQRLENNQGELTSVIECPEIRVILVDTRVHRSTIELVKKVTKLKEGNVQLWRKCIDDIGNLVEDAVQEILEKKIVNPQLFDENHRLLQILDVSHPSLDMIVDIGKSFGFSGKLTGAGGGGCAFIFIPPDQQSDSVSALKSVLTDKGFVYWDTKLGCPGFQASLIE